MSSREVDPEAVQRRTMRIAYIVNSFPCVTETFIVNQIAGVAARGHVVHIYATAGGAAEGLPAEVECHDLRQHIYRLHGSSNRLVRAARALGLLLVYGWRAPRVILRVLSIVHRRGPVGPLRLLHAVLTFVRLRKPHYDVIHAQFGQNGLFGMQLRDVGALSGRLITTFHGYDITSHLQSVGKHVYEPLFQAGDLFLPISEHWRRRLIGLGCVNNKIVVHRMGVDCRKFSFRAKEPDRDGTVRLVSIVRLVEKKGIEYGLRAIAKIAKTRSNIIYNVIGDGPLRAYLAQLSVDLGIASFVHLLGWKQHEEIVRILEDSHILLAPSVTSKGGDQEGIPVVLMEAMAMGLPVLSTQHSGIPELVEDGVSGLLVAERDVEALAERMTYLIDHPEIWAAMSRAGRSRIEAEYNIEKLNDELVNLYRAVAAQSRSMPKLSPNGQPASGASGTVASTATRMNRPQDPRLR